MISSIEKIAAQEREHCLVLVRTVVQLFKTVVQLFEIVVQMFGGTLLGSGESPLLLFFHFSHGKQNSLSLPYLWLQIFYCSCVASHFTTQDQLRAFIVFILESSGQLYTKGISTTLKNQINTIGTIIHQASSTQTILVKSYYCQNIHFSGKVISLSLSLLQPKRVNILNTVG